MEGKLENQLREYFLDKKLRPPENLKLLYYTYIYNTIMIIRDVSPKKFDNMEYAIPEGLISCLNTFPLAFILCDECDEKVGLYDLFQYCTNNIEEEVNMRIDLLSYMYPNRNKARHPYWPCKVSEDEDGTSMMVFSDSIESSAFSQIRDLKNKLKNK